MKKKISFFITFLLVMFITLSACYSQKESQKAELILKDRTGKKINLPKKPTKIVSLAPSITQVIVDLGEKDKLIATDIESTKIVSGLKKLPQFDMMSVDVERLIALKPQIVYITDLNQGASPDSWQQIEKAGITVVKIPTSHSIKDIKQDVAFIAKSLNKAKSGQQLVNQMDQELAKIRKIGKKITKKKKVYVEISPLPELYSFGHDVYLDEMLTMIGAENIFSDQKGWLPVNEETIIKRQPDVILTNVNTRANAVNEILNRRNWQTIPALKNQQVYQIDPISSSLPNQHITKALKEMAKAIYPQEYKELSDE